jgi:hypothetical protein
METSISNPIQKDKIEDASVFSTEINSKGGNLELGIKKPNQ